MIRVVAVLVATAIIAACSSPPPSPAPAVGTSATGDPRLEARTLAARGDWAGAVAAYRRALAATPRDAALRFALGSALSHLDKVGEAAEEFAWVVNHGPAGAPETAAARQWLVEAGLLAGPEGFRGPEAASPATTQKGDDEMQGIPYGSVRGVTRWPDPGIRRLKITLTGDDDATAGKRYRLGVLLNQPYVFNKIPAGAWRLEARSGDTSLWENRIVVEPSRETVVDLTPEQSKVRPGQLPPR